LTRGLEGNCENVLRTALNADANPATAIKLELYRR
jgi:hypothetical protein